MDSESAFVLQVGLSLGKVRRGAWGPTMTRLLPRRPGSAGCLVPDVCDLTLQWSVFQKDLIWLQIKQLTHLGYFVKRRWLFTGAPVAKEDMNRGAGQCSQCGSTILVKRVDARSIREP